MRLTDVCWAGEGSVGAKVSRWVHVRPDMVEQQSVSAAVKRRPTFVTRSHP
jgi:hypothetical protein